MLTIPRTSSTEQITEDAVQAPKWASTGWFAALWGMNSEMPVILTIRGVSTPIIGSSENI